jgi:hypothetical protein
MKYAELKELTGEQLNERYEALAVQVDKVKFSYEKAAKRECAAELLEMNLINHVFRVRNIYAR